jgi:hypothetical protein
MRLLIAALAIATLPAAAAAAGADDEAGAEATRLVQNADGSVTITQAIVPFPGDLEEKIDFAASSDPWASRATDGERRRRAREAADEAFDEAYEEAVDRARQEAGPD